MRTLGITTAAELRQADHRAVIAWERFMRETEHAAPSTIRRRLAALSSPVQAPGAARLRREEPGRARSSGRRSTATKARPWPSPRRRRASCSTQPPDDTVAGLRDRAILSVGLQVGLRRAEIAALKVGDLHQNRGYDSLRVIRKGGRRDALAINPQTRRAHPRLSASSPATATTSTGRCSGRCSHNGKRQERAPRMDPDAIDRVVRKYAAALGLDARLLGAFDARHLHHHGAGKRRPARGRAEGRRASRSQHHQAL